MSLKKNVAVVGSSAFVTCFEFVGAEGFNAENVEALVKIVNSLIEQKTFELIILPERFAKETKLLRDTVNKDYISPIFVLIPDFTMETGMRIDELHTIISSAIGSKVNL